MTIANCAKGCYHRNRTYVRQKGGDTYMDSMELSNKSDVISIDNLSKELNDATYNKTSVIDDSKFNTDSVEVNVTHNLSMSEKLRILTDAAKYDVACTSSGVDRSNKGSGLGDTHACGICHTFAADGRCVSRLRYYLLMSVYMIASIVLTEFLMMCREQHLHLMKFVN